MKHLLMLLWFNSLAAAAANTGVPDFPKAIAFVDHYYVTYPIGGGWEMIEARHERSMLILEVRVPAIQWHAMRAHDSAALLDQVLRGTLCLGPEETVFWKEVGLGSVHYNVKGDDGSESISIVCSDG
jgi:hypothetical protein